MSAPIEQVVAFTGVSAEVAKKALEENGGDVILTVERLSVPPSIRGDRYIPPKPTIDDGLTEEVRENLRKARQFSDILSASPQNDLRGKAASHHPSVSADFASAPQTQ